MVMPNTPPGNLGGVCHPVAVPACYTEPKELDDAEELSGTNNPGTVNAAAPVPVSPDCRQTWTRRCSIYGSLQRGSGS